FSSHTSASTCYYTLSLHDALPILFDSWAAAGYPRVDANRDGFYDSPALEIFGADDTSYSDLPDSAYPRALWHELLRRVFGDELADRKSTRLNSSHLVISYAVFCLK